MLVIALEANPICKNLTVQLNISANAALKPQRMRNYCNIQNSKPKISHAVLVICHSCIIPRKNTELADAIKHCGMAKLSCNI